MDDEAVSEQLTEKQTELIEFLYVDYNGLTRGKVIPLASLKPKLADGIGLTKATLNVSERDTILPVADMTPIGELRLIGDAASAHVLPYMPQVATLMGDIYNLDKTPYASDPRTILKRVVKQLADAGFSVKMLMKTSSNCSPGIRIIANRRCRELPFQRSPWTLPIRSFLKRSINCNGSGLCRMPIIRKAALASMN